MPHSHECVFSPEKVERQTSHSKSGFLAILSLVDAAIPVVEMNG